MSGVGPSESTEGRRGTTPLLLALLSRLFVKLPPPRLPVWTFPLNKEPATVHRRRKWVFGYYKPRSIREVCPSDVGPTTLLGVVFRGRCPKYTDSRLDFCFVQWPGVPSLSPALVFRSPGRTHRFRTNRFRPSHPETDREVTEDLKSPVFRLKYGNSPSTRRTQTFGPNPHDALVYRVSLTLNSLLNNH